MTMRGTLVVASRALRAISEIPTFNFWSRAMVHPPPQTNVARRFARRFSKRSPAERARQFLFARTLLAQLGGFHPLLGLGTKLSGGEDTEFVHRAFHRARKHSLCIPGFLVGHAAADPKKKAAYYEGGLAAIMAHSRTSAAARVALIRKLAVGVGLVITRRMSASHYLQSLRTARAHAPIVRAGPG